MSTKIEWTDETWNPVRGCTIVSEGCKNCYAMKFAHRFSGEGKPYEGLTRQTSTGPKWTGKVELSADTLYAPLKPTRKAKMIFVCSMSDLFHESVPFEYIDKVMAIIALSKHSFQVLTKRSERMADYFRADKEDLAERWGFATYVLGLSDADDDTNAPYNWIRHRIAREWPLPNLWIGISIENQKTADERIPHLLQIPAAVRFLSCEPLLGPVHFYKTANHMLSKGNRTWDLAPLMTGIHWVIAGGESGHGARPMHPDWVRSLRDQCDGKYYGVPFFFKQWGEWLPMDHLGEDLYWDSKESREVGYSYTSNTMFRVGKKKSGNFLDGRQFLEFPRFTELEGEL